MKTIPVAFSLLFCSLCAIGGDIDYDGIPDEADALPYDESEYLDTDLDGYGDNSDDFPSDPAIFRDADNDGVADEADERAAGEFFGEGAIDIGEDPLLLLEYDSSDYNNLEPDRRSLAVFNGHLYFPSYDSEKRHALMSYDGTNITKIFQLESASTPVSKLTVANEALYFIAGDQFSASYGRGNLYKFNGTDITLEVEDIERQYRSPKLGYAVMRDGTLYFEADRDNAGPELWRKTSAGDLSRITDFNTNNSFNFGSSIDGTMCVLGNTLFFSVSTSNTSGVPEGIYSLEASSDQPVLEISGVTYIKNCAESDTSLYIAHSSGLHSSLKTGDDGRIWTRPFFQTHSGGLGTPSNSGDVINQAGEIFAWLYGGDRRKEFAPYHLEKQSEQFVEIQPATDEPYFSSNQLSAFFIRSNDQTFFFRGSRKPFNKPEFQYGDKYQDLYSFSHTERPRKRRELVSNVSYPQTNDTAPVTGAFFAGDVYVIKAVQNDNRRERFILKQISIGQDRDMDGVDDTLDRFELDPSEQLDTDNDGVGNNTDADDDNDGVVDSEDAFPLDSNESVDTDGDGVGNNADTDDDGDGYSDSDESSAGTDPLDANSYPEVTEEETGGMPIWLYYIVTQPEASSKSAP